MAKLFRQQYTREIPPDANIIERKGSRFARFRDDDGKTIEAPLTKDGARCRVESARWYTDIRQPNGTVKRVALATNRTAAEMMRGELLRKAEMGLAGAGDPFEEHRAKPLAEHLADYKRHLDAKGNCSEHVALTVGRIAAGLNGCRFVRMADLSASRLAEWLSEARQVGIVTERGAQPTGNAKSYAEISKAFGVSEGTVGYWRQHGAPIRPKKENEIVAGVDSERATIAMRRFNALVAWLMVASRR